MTIDTRNAGGHLVFKSSSGHQSAKLKSYWPNMIRGHKSKKNEVLHDHIHHYLQKSPSTLVTQAAIFFNVKYPEIPHFPRGSWGLIFFVMILSAQIK